jgi:hypothetical protein
MNLQLSRAIQELLIQASEIESLLYEEDDDERIEKLTHQSEAIYKEISQLRNALANSN